MPLTPLTVNGVTHKRLLKWFVVHRSIQITQWTSIQQNAEFSRCKLDSQCVRFRIFSIWPEFLNFNLGKNTAEFHVSFYMIVTLSGQIFPPPSRVHDFKHIIKVMTLIASLALIHALAIHKWTGAAGIDVRIPAYTKLVCRYHESGPTTNQSYSFLPCFLSGGTYRGISYWQYHERKREVCFPCSIDIGTGEVLEKRMVT